ncbi:uncharacterized protein G2W53_042266 [Senna tora]|uniref:Uncharacterized protein n=1 Tax=Senna tora TaxID=362788 RepID=A0A834SF37_9FABA|nr:uncharacterized protein G2W53_042266 [Senna tora]
MCNSNSNGPPPSLAFILASDLVGLASGSCDREGVG